jgi:LmbE family N-acetylglucosaminyl deacetylase
MGRGQIPTDHHPKAGSRLVALVPALNEAGRIGRVLEVLRQVRCIDEIVVIDDGSVDAMLAEVRQAAQSDPRLRIMINETNLGKGQSLFKAWRAMAAGSGAGYILMLDADLINLTPQHVLDLVQPVLDGACDMTMGLFKGGAWRTDASHWITPWLTGQRCLRTGLFDFISENAARGYGFETALTVAARRQGWTIRKVILHGVSHPPNENHRGVWRGVFNRACMYAQIVRAGLITYRRPAKPTQGLLRRVLISILLLLIGAGMLYDDRVVASNLKPSDLQALPVAGVQRLLVVAPHPDDEVLGSGGLIQAALAQGSQVRVVVMTNGDGQIIAPLALEKNPVPRPGSYIYIGKERQAESLAALQRVGVPANQVYFLSYPDGGMNILWMNDWQTQCPLYTRLTEVTASPYPITFDPQARYCGSFVLKDLSKILQDYQPDFISIPHPNDHHPDHRAAYNFMQMAIALARSHNPAYHPEVWGYLVHYGDYPQPRGLHANQALMPPGTLSGVVNIWARLDLTPGQEHQKETALKAYVTQQKLLGAFLMAFVRPDEIFADLKPLDLPSLAFYGEAQQDTQPVSTPALTEPTRQTASMALIASADILSWQVRRSGSTLWFIVKTRGSLAPELNYSIFIKTPQGKTRVIDCNGPDNRWAANAFYAKVDLAQLGGPAVVGLSAESSQEMVLDRTAWHFWVIGPPVSPTAQISAP